MHQPFAANLRLARIAAGLTQRALAQRLTDAGLPIDPSAVTRLDDATDVFRVQIEAAARAAIDMRILVDGQPYLLVELKSATGKTPDSIQQFLPWLTHYVHSRTPSAGEPDESYQDELRQFALAIVTGLFRSPSTSQEV